MEISGFITVAEAAKRIGLTDKRVYQLIQEERIQAEEWGRVYLVKVSSVDRYLKERNGSRRPTKGKRK